LSKFQVAADTLKVYNGPKSR